MCGLFGFKTKVGVNLTDDHRMLRAKAVTLLALEMETRGDKSTGIASIYENGQTHITKRALPAREFIKMRRYAQHVVQAPMVLGHTRLPTTGAVTDENAHPFHEGDIIGAHNGVVTNHYALDNTVNVDSEVIFKKLNEEKNNFVKVFKELMGSYAITWASISTPTDLNFVTHINPLYYFHSPLLDTLFWASEETPLLLIQRILTEENEKIIYPGEDRVITFHHDLSYSMTEVDFKVYVLPPPTSTTHSAPNQAAWDHHRHGGKKWPDYDYEDQYHLNGAHEYDNEEFGAAAMKNDVPSEKAITVFDEKKKKKKHHHANTAETSKIVALTTDRDADTIPTSSNFVTSCKLCREEIDTSVERSYYSIATGQRYCSGCGWELAEGQPQTIILLFAGQNEKDLKDLMTA